MPRYLSFTKLLKKRLKQFSVDRNPRINDDWGFLLLELREEVESLAYALNYMSREEALTGALDVALAAREIVKFLQRSEK